MGTMAILKYVVWPSHGNKRSSRCSCELPQPCGQGLLDILGARSTKGPLTVNSAFSASFWDDEITNRIIGTVDSCDLAPVDDFQAFLPSYNNQKVQIAPESHDFVLFREDMSPLICGEVSENDFFTSLWRAIEGTLGQFLIPWCGPLPSSSIESIAYHLVPVIIKTS